MYNSNNCAFYCKITSDLIDYIQKNALFTRDI